MGRRAKSLLHRLKGFKTVHAYISFSREENRDEKERSNFKKRKIEGEREHTERRKKDRKRKGGLFRDVLDTLLLKRNRITKPVSARRAPHDSKDRSESKRD